MKRTGNVFFKDVLAGIVWQDENGYGFTYHTEYLNSLQPMPVSLTLPLRTEPFTSNTMIPFFDGLIPEGWLLDINVKNWKLDPNDRMELLLTVCKDCIGAVSIVRMKTEQLS